VFIHVAVYVYLIAVSDIFFVRSDPVKKSCIGHKCKLLCANVKNFQLGGPNPYLSSHGPHWGDFGPRALSAMSAYNSVYGCGLVMLYAARQTPGESRTRVWFLVLQEFGALQVTKVMDSWLHNTDKNFCPDLP